MMNSFTYKVQLSSFFGLSLFLSACLGGKSEKLKFSKIIINTFDNSDTKPGNLYPRELQSLVQPFPKDEGNIVFSKITFWDKICSKRKSFIDLKEFSKDNAGGTSIEGNTNTSSMLLKRLFDPKDGHKPEDIHFLYKHAQGLQNECNNEFSYKDYFDKMRNDTSKIFFVWAEEEPAETDTIVFTELTKLRTAIAAKLRKHGWRDVVIAYKPGIVLKTPVKKEICDNRLDDDGDGLVDCLDSLDCEPCLNQPEVKDPSDVKKCSDPIDPDKSLILDLKNKKEIIWEDVNNDVNYNWKIIDPKSSNNGNLTSGKIQANQPNIIRLPKLAVGRWNVEVEAIFERCVEGKKIPKTIKAWYVLIVVESNNGETYVQSGQCSGGSKK